MLQQLGQGQAAGIQLMASSHFVTWAANIKENFSTTVVFELWLRYFLASVILSAMAMRVTGQCETRPIMGPIFQPLHTSDIGARAAVARYVLFAKCLALAAIGTPVELDPSQKLTTSRFLRRSDNRCDGHCILSYIHSQAVMRVAWFSNCTSEHP